MGLLPGFSIGSGRYTKSSTLLFYPHNWGYIYPPLDTNAPIWNREWVQGVLFDLEGIYRTRPMLEVEREVINSLPNTHVWLYTGVRNLDDLIDAVVLEPEGVFVSTATVSSHEDLTECLESAEIAGLAIDLDPKGRIIGPDDLKRRERNIEGLLSLALDVGTRAVGFTFWSKESIKNGYVNGVEINSISSMIEDSGIDIDLFLMGPFPSTPPLSLTGEGWEKINIVLPFNTL